MTKDKSVVHPKCRKSDSDKGKLWFTKTAFAVLHIIESILVLTGNTARSLNRMSQMMLASQVTLFFRV